MRPPLGRGLWPPLLVSVVLFAMGGCTGGGPHSERSQQAFVRHPVEHAVLQLWPGDLVRARIRASGQKIALIDTGVAGSYANSCIGCAIKMHGDGLGDESGHGTALAALLAGSVSLGFVGVAADATVGVFPLAPRYGDIIGGEALARAIDQAVQEEYTVINVSLGSPTPDPLVRDSVARALSAGVVLIAAAGEDPDRMVLYPAAFPGVISVRAAPMHENAGLHVTGHRNHHDGSLVIPIAEYLIPRYNAENEMVTLGESEESSEASALVAGIAAVHRGLQLTCPRLPTLTRFVTESLSRQTDARESPWNPLRYCE